MTEDHKNNLIAIVQKFIGLGIKNPQFQRIEDGPVITAFIFTLGASTPIARVLNKEEDFALACGSESCVISRIGGEISIALPNKNRTIVSFDSCLYAIQNTPEFASMRLPLMLGVDTVGKPACIDLKDQPHILIAGQTGGGKSVLLASFISGLITRRTPTEMRLILVDTKKLDLPLYGDLPHVADNVDSVEKFHVAMDRLMKIVRDRTTKMQGISRNLDEYNAAMVKINAKQLPYYVVIIDELADLIDADKELHDNKIQPYCDSPKVQPRLKSLLQICRAAGIYVICATQRSSTKVISGDIKANLPTRIALRLPSRFDSATILSGSGAENLLGKGDMLVETSTSSSAIRYHGAFVDLSHVGNILNQHEMLRESFKQITQCSNTIQ